MASPHHPLLKQAFVVPKLVTSSKVLTGTDSGTAWHNLNSTGTVTMTLPKAAPGLTYQFLGLTNFPFIIAPKMGDTIRGNPTSASIAIYAGYYIGLLCIEQGFWEIINEDNPQLPIIIADPTGNNDSSTEINTVLQSGVTGAILPGGTYLTLSPLLATTQSMVLFSFGTIFTNTGWTPTSTNYIFNSNAPRQTLWGLNIDGGFSGNTCIADGIAVNQGRTRVESPTITHFPNVGLGFISAVSGDSNSVNPNIQQWNNVDGPFATDANFTSSGIYFNRPDCFVSAGYSRWSKYPVHFGPSAGTNRLENGFHPYNGRPGGTAMVDPIIVYAETGSSGITIDGCYLDDGRLEFFTKSVHLVNNKFLQTSATTYTADANGFAHVIRVYATAVNDFLDPFEMSNTTGTLATGTHLFYPMPNGGNNWAGDYTALDTLQTGPSSAQTIECNEGKIIVYGSNTVGNVGEARFSGNSPITMSYTVGTGTAITEVYHTPAGGPNTKTVTVDIFLLNPATGTTTKFQIGSSNVYWYNDGSGNLIGGTGATDRWGIASGGNWYPIADQTSYLGKPTTNRINGIFLGSGGGAGTPCIDISNSATTGTGTATLTATNKPGANKSSPDKWLPMELDGTLGSVPWYAN